MKKVIFTLVSIFIYIGLTNAQSSNKGLAVYLNSDSTHYIKFGGLTQLWVRHIQTNPGSTLYGDEIKNATDFSVRRIRATASAQITKKTFAYAHVGLNNLYNLGTRKQGVFVHDATIDHTIFKNYFTLGFGLHGWNGTARFSSSSTTSIMGYDLPLIQETTNDVTDQFGRKYGMYGKGKINKLDYRFAISKPMPIQNALSSYNTTPILDRAVLSEKYPKMNYAGYVNWQFLDQESNQLPYATGSYLGKKRVLNIGLGFQYQEDFTWQLRNGYNGFFVQDYALKQIGFDVFYDSYLNKEKNNAVTIYASYLKYNFGENFVRNMGVMNVANGTNQSNVFNGFGNAFPMHGTGNVFFTQFAYKLKDNLIGNTTLQPYSMISIANYQALNGNVDVYNLGMNVLFIGHQSKLTLDYQIRPYYISNANSIDKMKNKRLGAITLQYQIAI